ncbi:MAG: YdcF family protein [Gemmatimonadota bacterium]
MVSSAKVRQVSAAPIQGAALALLILGAGWVTGLLQASVGERPITIPIAIVVGLLLGRWALRWMAMKALLLMVVAAIGIWSPLVPRLARPFVRNDPVNLESVDAVFVFSGAVTSRGLLSGESLDRLLTGIMLRSKRPSLPLVVSVMRSEDRPAGLTSMPDQRQLIAMMPAAGPLETIDSVASTRDEAVRLTRRAFQARWKRVAVVTSPMHTRRACATVEALGLPVTCVMAPWRVAGWPARTPRDRMLVMQRLVYESLAWAQYRVTGWASWG